MAPVPKTTAAKASGGKTSATKASASKTSTKAGKSAAKTKTSSKGDAKKGQTAERLYITKLKEGDGDHINALHRIQAVLRGFLEE